MSFRLALAILVFALDAWALWRIFATTAPRKLRWKWVLFVVGLPLAGILLWRRDARARMLLQ